MHCTGWQFNTCLKIILLSSILVYLLHQASEAIKFGAEILGSTPPASGIYEINHVCGNEPHVFHTSVPAMQARCSNGGWTVILRRKADVSQQVNFTRTWNDYKHGFGELNTEFWYGLKNIHCLTSRQQVDLQIDIKYGSGSQLTTFCCWWTRKQLYMYSSHWSAAATESRPW